MNKKGFTLVELLAVIAILAILVIIALPNVLSMYNEARKNTFVTESIQNTLKMYLIIGLISLFIGLLIVFVKKVIKLFKPDNNVKEIKTIKNEKNDDKNIFMLKIVNPIFSDNKITGTLEETEQHIEVYIEKKKK